MKKYYLGPSSIACEIGLDESEVARCKALLELSDSDAALLRKIHNRLEEERGVLTSAICDRVSLSAHVGRLLGGREIAERLNSMQASYLGELTCGEYGVEYVKDRLQASMVYRSLGLEPTWVLAIYRKFLSELNAELWRLLRKDPEQLLTTFDAVLKAVFLDIRLILEGYLAQEPEATATYAPKPSPADDPKGHPCP